MQDVQINDNFAKLSEALYVAEHKAREAVALRSKGKKEMMKEKERKEEELRAFAQKPHVRRTGVPQPPAAPIPSERSERGVNWMMVKCNEIMGRDALTETRQERELYVWLP